MKKEVIMTSTYEFEFDENSAEYKSALASYKRIVEKNDGEKDLLCHVVHNLNQFGNKHLIEGVGYISINGIPQGTPYSGIELLDPDIDFIYDIT